MLSERQAYTSAWSAGGYTWGCGWTVERARRAIELHDNQGCFHESYAASEKVTQWSRIFGALEQRIAPTLRLPRAVEGAMEGLDGLVRKEAEELFVGEERELGSAFPSLAGTVRLHAMMGFCWWQTSWRASPDASTVVPKTEIWPVSATRWDQARRTWVALTQEEGAVDIDPEDPRWTLVADGDRPWLSGAIRPISPEYMEAMFSKDDRADYADQHGRPKPVGILPDGISVEDEVGQAAQQAMEQFREPEASAIFPHGMNVQQFPPSAEVAALFKDIIEDDAAGVAIALLGTDGTMSKGTGGVYSSPIFSGVAEARVAADVTVVKRAAQQVIARWRARNYPTAATPKATIWMPDSDRDMRTKSLAERLLLLHKIIDVEAANGFTVTQGRVNDLAKRLDVPPPTVASMGYRAEALHEIRSALASGRLRNARRLARRMRR